MKRPIRAFFAVGLCLMLLFLWGCGASASKSKYAMENAAPAFAADSEAASYQSVGLAMPNEQPNEKPTEASNDTPSAVVMTSVADKIIYSAAVSLETTAFDETLSTLENAISNVQGFIQSSAVNGNPVYSDDGSTHVIDRYAEYVVRVPAAKLNLFLEKANAMGNVTNQSRQADNITSQFMDTQARVESLTAQEDRLQKLMADAPDMESIIALEARLSEVRFEIESLQRDLQNWQSQVDFSTVTIYLQEVSIYTPTAAVTRSYGQRVVDAFRDGWSGFIRGLGDLLVFLIEALPVLLLLAAVVTVVVVLIRKRRERRRPKPEEKQ